jgi:branched-chain amino acid transport system permease protein
VTSRRRARLLGAFVLAAYVVLPLRLSDFGLAVLNLAGIAAIGAVGLNLVVGYTGVISLGHAAFLGVGAYACAAMGASLHLPFPVWLAGAAALGALLGLAVGPFAARYRGHTVAVVTLALVFVAQHVFRAWGSLTGGHGGRADLPSPHLASVDLGNPGPLTPDQAWFWLVWALVVAVVLLVANVVKGRPGRAMLAVRAGDQAAAVMGVDVARTKVAAFALSGALAAVAGALYGSYKHYVGPDEWSLLLSIQYLAIVLIGGAGTLWGPVLGAVFVTGVPRLVEQAGGLLPFLAQGTERGLTMAQLNQLLFGVLIVVFVVAEPRGLAALGPRLWARVTSSRSGRTTIGQRT